MNPRSAPLYAEAPMGRASISGPDMLPTCIETATQRVRDLVNCVGAAVVRLETKLDRVEGAREPGLKPDTKDVPSAPGTLGALNDAIADLSMLVDALDAQVERAQRI